MNALTIERVRLVEIDLPLRVPFQISGGTMRRRRSLIVELHSGGAVGYGESAPFERPFYSSETLGSVLALYNDLLIERIEGETFESIAEFVRTLGRGVRGNRFARCGFENAFWDLTAAAEEKSYQRLIAEEMQRQGVAEEFRRFKGRVASGVAIGIPENEEARQLRRWIEGYREQGYRRVKIKIRPGWEREPCRVAREILGDDFLLWPDANASFELSKHIDVFRSLDEFGLTMIEQPLHHADVLDHARLAKKIKTPLCLDESLRSARTARQAIEQGAAAIWNIKVQRMGGLLEAIEAYALAVRHGIGLWGGTMPESGIGAQAILALASFAGFVYPADVEPSARWYEPGTDPVSIEMSEEGWIDVPETPGLGRLIDREIYRRVGRAIRK